MSSFALLRTVFNGYKILSSFSFNIWKMLCYFLLASMVSESNCVIQIVFIVLPLWVCCLFLTAFKIIFLSFVFKSLTVMCFGMSLSEFISLEFAQFLESGRLMFSVKLGKFLGIISLDALINFSVPYSFSSPTGTLMTDIKSFVIVLQVSDPLSLFL